MLNTIELTDFNHREEKLTGLGERPLHLDLRHTGRYGEHHRELRSGAHGGDEPREVLLGSAEVSRASSWRWSATCASAAWALSSMAASWHP